MLQTKLLEKECLLKLASAFTCMKTNLSKTKLLLSLVSHAVAASSVLPFCHGQLATVVIKPQVALAAHQSRDMLMYAD